MEAARLKWRGTTTTPLLGFLPLMLLIPGAFALHCHSFTSIQPVSRDRISSEFSVASSISSNCSAGQNACVEAHLMLSTENTAMLVTHRGCASEGLKDETTGSPTSGDQYFTVLSSVRYCRSDLCNGEPMDLNVFRIPEQDKASQASSSSQCYSGFSLDPKRDILDRVTCGKDYSQCYHGNGTVTVGHLAAEFLIKTCRDSSCNVPESRSYGPIELKLWGSCCQGIFCNGKAVASLGRADNTTAAAWTTARLREENSTTRPTHFPRLDIANDTGDVFTEDTEEVADTPDREGDSDVETETTRNTLYDYEEDDYNEVSASINNTLNPRARSLGPPKLSLSFCLLLIDLGIVIFRLW